MERDLGKRREGKLQKVPFFVWVSAKVNDSQFFHEINFDMEKGMHYEYGAGERAEHLDFRYVFKSTVPEKIHP